jgi:glycerate-2-kinase
LKRAKEKSIDVYGNLMKHNSSPVLRDLEDAVYTEPTGTNVMNLRVIVIGDS